MSPAHGLCPECLARVLPDWSVCKFCGHNLVGVVPAPWQEPEGSASAGAGGQSPGAQTSGEGMSFFDMYGDFDTTTPAADDFDDADEMLALPPAPGDEQGEIPDVAPYDLPYDTDDEVAPPAATRHSLFGSRDARSDGAPESADAGSSGPDADWWMHADSPPGSTDSFGAGSPIRDEPASSPWDEAPGAGVGARSDADVAFEPSSWDAPAGPSAALSRLEGPATILPPAAKPPLISREFRLLAMGIALILVIIVGWIVVDNSTKPVYPSAWDGRITSLARYVSTERDLAFTHAVKVRFLEPAEYREEVDDEVDRYMLGKTEAQRLAAEYRALGLIAPGAAEASVARPDLGGPAFYSFRKHTLYVEGTRVTPKLKAALVHQLTHALDDQHFDMGALRSARPESFSLWSVAEGDAAMMERLYVEQLSEKDRAAYDADHLSIAPKAPVDLWGVLASDSSSFGSLFGRVIHSSGGWQVMNQALSFPPSSDSQLFDPFRYLEGDRALHVTSPEPPDGSKAVMERTLGAGGMYLILADHIDPLAALAAADAWGGDTLVTYRNKSDVTCVTLRVRGAADADRTVIEHAFNLLHDALGADRLSVNASGDLVDVQGCDPGENASGVDRSAQTVLVPLLRTRIAIDLYDEIKTIPNGVNGPILSLTQTRCIAQRVISTLPQERLLSLEANPLTSAEQKAATDAATPLCKDAFTPSAAAGPN